MLPVGKALIGYLAHSGVIGPNVLSAVGRQPTSSALPDIESSGILSGSLLGTMTSADFPRHFLLGISPGKSALLHGATAAFTSATEPRDFAVLCQLVASRRPSYAVLVHRPANFS